MKSKQLTSYTLLNRSYDDILFRDTTYAITFCSLKRAISSLL